MAVDGRQKSSQVCDHRLARVHRRSLADLHQREIGILYCGDMTDDHLALRHNKCRKIHRGYPFGHVADENPCFEHGLLGFLHLSKLWVEEMILAETHLPHSLAYTPYLPDRGSQQRNQVPARQTALMDD